MIDAAKPPVPAEATALHYLLSTPFRYPPLAHGSRFATRFERGIWYGEASRRTAFAETAFYRFLFLEGTAGDVAPLAVDLSLFRARVATALGADLAARELEPHLGAIASKTSYDVTQRLGRAMREAGVKAFRYPSARDVRAGSCFGVLSPAAFASSRPSPPQSWYAVVRPEAVEIVKRDVFRHQAYRFPRGDFLVEGELPSPGLR
jgi:hypothetical protein